MGLLKRERSGKDLVFGMAMNITSLSTLSASFISSGIERSRGERDGNLLSMKFRVILLRMLIEKLRSDESSVFRVIAPAGRSGRKSQTEK